jgi:hypothetical protein
MTQTNQMENKMKNKNQIVVTGLLAGFTIFGPNLTLAADTCLEMPGKLHAVSVGPGPLGWGQTQVPDPEADIRENIRRRLPESAFGACNKNEFCIDDTSIVSEGSKTSAIINCLE